MYTYNESRLRGFPYSGYNLVDEVNQLNPSKVVDVGCGENLFKGLIQNLYGFDIDNYPNIDEQGSIQTVNIEPDSVDVALCLGSLQYLKREYQLDQLTKVVSWIKPGGYIIVRNQPFVDYEGHNEEYIAQFGIKHRMYYSDFYDWTEKLQLSVYKPIRLEINSNFPELERLVWWWRKST